MGASAHLAMERPALLFGHGESDGLVAVERVDGCGGPDKMACFFRRGKETVREDFDFRPFIVMAKELLDGLAVMPVAHHALSGSGPLNCLAEFASWLDCLKAKDGLVKKTGARPTDAAAPYLFLNDPVQQYLLRSGRTQFGQMSFRDVKRMQLDIECRTTPGYEFCNADREGDCILAIGLGDSVGWEKILSSAEMSEKVLLENLVACVQERDPDVIEGHNLFNFDLPYIEKRARRHGVKLALGRDGSEPRSRPGRFTAGERTIGYERFEIFGRHIVDTFLLAHAYDVSHRAFDGFGLKEVAAQLGLAAPDREHIPGDMIGATFQTEPDRVLRYLRHDVMETGRLSEVLSRSQFVQGQMLPLGYQSVCVRGNAARIDSLMTREYLRRGLSLPLPDAPREFEGGYTDIFATGVVSNVHHCDVRSLYPSIMLQGKLGPRRDEAGAFLEMLRALTLFRIEAKARANNAVDASERVEWDAVQSTFKTLINSFYGYLGFGQARFSDFARAEEVTRQGREILCRMVARLKSLGARPIEIDTDGVYFVPPDGLNDSGMTAFQLDVAADLPDGIQVEFDGNYRAMFSYRMKNYALLGNDGALIIKGAALKSRGLEPFQRRFLRDMLRLKLSGNDAQLSGLKTKYENAIRNREWPIRELAKTETLQDAPSTYKAKMARSARSRNAAYELALASGREYRAGDQVSYYVAGNRKTVAVHEAAKLVSDWNPCQRDENVPYYLAKLDALYAKFEQEETQDEWAFPE